MMIELKINVEESLVNSFGQQSLEKQVEDFLKKIELRMAAKDILIDLDQFDLTNDAKWKTARRFAWETAKNDYIITTK